MTEEKGLDGIVADKIWEYAKLKGGMDVLTKLESDAELSANKSAAGGLADMRLLFKYLGSFGVLEKISFDMSLARGLDYYTGVIYEVVTEGSAPPTAEGQKLQHKAKKEAKSHDPDEDRSSDSSVGVGSVAAGGRYDELVGMFKGKGQVPCVGISFGVDRIFSITKARMEKEKAKVAIRPTEVDVYVMAFGGGGFTGLLNERMQVSKQLWESGIKTEFSLRVKPKLPVQFKAAETAGIPFGVILGEDELIAGKIKIKEMGLPEGHPEKEGVLVNKDDLVPEIKKRLAEFYSRSVAEVTEKMEDAKVQDRDDVPGEPPVIPTVT